MNILLFSTIIVFSSAVAKLVAVPFWRLFSRRPELLPGVLAVFAAIAGSLLFAAGRYPSAEAVRWPHFLFALLFDLIGWAVWIILARQDGKKETV